MTTPPALLLSRLDEIGRSLERSAHACALLALGSVGLERERLDCYSDLDFFAVVEDGFKQSYIRDLTWLSRIAPVAFSFQNTNDGHKLLYEDGVFCEFAVFELAELPQIAYAEGVIVWKKSDVSELIARPVRVLPAAENTSEEFLLGEALTNLYVGLSRHARGERLSAARFIQHYAVDRVCALAELTHCGPATAKDPFSYERRFELRMPGLSGHLPSFIQGYARSVESAVSILDYIEAHYDVNAAMVRMIRELAAMQN